MIRLIATTAAVVLLAASRVHAQCPTDAPLNAQYPLLLDENNTQVIFAGQDAFFVARVVVPSQYTSVEISFDGASDPSGGFDSVNVAHWNVTAAGATPENPCDTIYTSNIPWDDFRTDLGGVLRTDHMGSVSFYTTITLTGTYDLIVTPETLLELRKETGDKLLQIGNPYVKTNSVKVPIEIIFDTEVTVDDSIFIPTSSLRISAALLDTSVISVTPDPFSSTARLEFLTTVPLPLILDNITVSTVEAHLQPGMFWNEIIALRQCDPDSAFCVQRWEVTLYPTDCNLNGDFNVDVVAVCHDERQGCMDGLIGEDEASFVASITSDDFCPDVQTVGLSGDLELFPTTCNQLLTGEITLEGSDDDNNQIAAIQSVEILEVLATPALENPQTTIVTVYDQANSVSILNYADDTATATNLISFQFEWEGAQLRCDVVANVEVRVRVEYEATAKLLSFGGNSKTGMSLLQSSDDETVILGESVRIGADANDPSGGNNVGNGNGGEMSMPMIIGILVGLAVALVGLVAGGLFYVRRLRQKNGAMAAAPSSAEMVA